jgi:type VI secretion system secreted protein VgrG
MSDFTTALNYTLKHEGGWANNPDDPGGPTMFGITLNTAKRHGIDDADALKKISPEMAAAILREGYWRFGSVADQRVATKVFDMSVNMGLATAVKLLQKSLNVYGAELRVDGVFGAETSRAVNSHDPELILDLLCGVSREHYEQVAARSPSSKRFLGGWKKRANMRPT